MNDFWDNYDWAAIAQNVAIALLILLITWILARVVKWAITKLVSKVGFFQREADNGRSIGAALGQVAALLVWLFGLVAILQVFALDQVLAPVQGMLGTILGYLPNIIAATFVFFIGYVIARIVKELILAALSTVDLDRHMRRISPDRAADSVTGSPGSERSGATVGTGSPTGEPRGTRTAEGSAQTTTGRSTGNTIATVLANLAFAVILIVVGIAALQILGISAISDPAQQMLTRILQAIPAIIAAALILGIGWLIAKFVGQILEGTLRAVGTDRAEERVGILPEGQSASSILARIAQVAIMLFFAIMAAQALNFPQITQILNEVLELGGRVLFGAVIIGAGFVIAGLLARAIGEGTASKVVRYATIVLFVAMGLQFMGIANSIINLAFGAVVVGAALAAAIAYGVGGRDAAARSLRRLEAKQESTPPGS
ncbi:MAG: mechanosensitive ion channel [Chloroflexota bacterium]|nr:mechanosensitive ion channel [Chloroflexota bacterium]